MSWLVHLAMVTAQFLFASLTVAAKFVLPNLSPAGVVLNQLFFLKGVKRTTAINTNILVTTVRYIFLFGALYIIPVGIWSLRRVDVIALPPRALFALAYIVLFSSVLAYYLSVWALRRTASSLVAMYVYLQPVMTAFGAPMILGERVTPRAGLAAALIFAGLALATFGEQRSGRALGAAFRPPAEGV